VVAVTGVGYRCRIRVIPPVGLITVAFNLPERDHGHFVTCNRLDAVRLGGLRLMAQSYVGKRPTSKGIGRGIQRFMIGAVAPCFLASAARAFTARRTVADLRGYAPKVAIPVSSKPPALNELPSLPRSALIPFAGDPGCSAAVVTQIA
jgi:hypothetical protein